MYETPCSGLLNIPNITVLQYRKLFFSKNKKIEFICSNCKEPFTDEVNKKQNLGITMCPYCRIIYQWEQL